MCRQVRRAIGPGRRREGSLFVPLGPRAGLGRRPGSGVPHRDDDVRRDGDRQLGQHRRRVPDAGSNWHRQRPGRRDPLRRRRRARDRRRPVARRMRRRGRRLRDRREPVRPMVVRMVVDPRRRVQPPPGVPDVAVGQRDHVHGVGRVDLGRERGRREPGRLRQPGHQWTITRQAGSPWCRGSSGCTLAPPASTRSPSAGPQPQRGPSW